MMFVQKEKKQSTQMTTSFWNSKSKSERDNQSNSRRSSNRCKDFFMLLSLVLVFGTLLSDLLVVVTVVDVGICAQRIQRKNRE